ncbi:MAG: hypothetical protein HY301_12065 [Verrucomicrobia bacterium]|nr:hypothetical protein [Verrucomicrobiota bacterium]
MNPRHLRTIFYASMPRGGWPAQFAVITGWHRGGAALDRVSNEANHDSLRTEIFSRGLLFFPIATTGPDLASAFEPAFGIACALGEGWQLGRQFKQETIYWVDEGQLALVACAGAQPLPLPLASWTERVGGEMRV